MTKILILKCLIIFSVSFILRILILLYTLSRGLWGSYDAFIYLPVADKYIEGIIRHEYSYLLLNIEHPPLAKIMIGLFRQLPLAPNFSSLICMSFFSSLTGLVIFLYMIKYDEKYAVISWLLYALDPFSIHWTIAWLDSIMLFFLTVALCYMLKEKLNRKRAILTGLILGLSALCKYTALIIFTIFLIILKLMNGINTRNMLIVLLSCSSILFLNPQLWINNGFYKIITRNQEVGNINVPLLILPFIAKQNKVQLLIWIPSYLWSFSSCNIRTAPFILPFICFIVMIYFKYKFEKLILPKETITWISSTLIAFSILPKMYPYYYIVIVPSLSILISEIIYLSKVRKNTRNEKKNRFFRNRQ